MSNATHRTGSAVVIGASMAGLSVAAALADTFDQVAIFDRDPLPDGEGHRKGVPQDRHLHLLLPAGVAALEDLLPGLLIDLLDAGATAGDADRIRICVNGQRLARTPIGEVAVFGDRSRIEAVVRRRVRDLPGVQVHDRCRVTALDATPDGKRVTGVRVNSHDCHEETRRVEADLVVDCSGRGSRATAWLSELGYAVPDVDTLEVGVSYVTRVYTLPADVLGGDHHVLVGPTANNPAGGAMTRIDDGRWLVTLFAVGDAPPPSDLDDFRRYAARLAIDDIHQAIGTGDGAGPASRYRFVANVRHRYERVSALPDGLLVAGDALCSFNPIYGQGMSVAALEARQLRQLLRDAGVPTPAEWFATVAPTVAAAWELATGADLALPDVVGRRSPVVRIANAYLRRLHAAAARDPVLATRFVRVAALLDPPSALLRPVTIARVLRHHLTGRGRGGSPS